MRVTALTATSPRAQALRAAGRDAAAAPPSSSEIGVQGYQSITPWANMFQGDMVETVGELMWPQSVNTYSAILNDAQAEGLLTGATQPIFEYYWWIEKNGADDKLWKMIQEDFNLPGSLAEAQGSERLIGRARDRFSFSEHMFHAFRALVYGHYFFEIVCETDGDDYWRLRKLAPRPPKTIGDIEVANNGDLIGIKQNIGPVNQLVPLIPAAKLAPYIWDKEGANWVGRSMFRSIFRNWVIKDKLIRVAAQSAERFGMGIPIATGQPGAQEPDLAALDRMAQRIRGGKTAGGALPNGASITIEGVRGASPDVIAQIRYHDEQMSKRFIQNFNDAGSTPNGSRAVAEVQHDHFRMTQKFLATWFRDTVNKWVIETLADYNFAAQEQVPLLRFAIPEDVDPVSGFQQMIGDGTLVADPTTAEAIQQASDVAQAEIASKTSPKPASTPGGVQAKARGAAVRRAAAADGTPSTDLPLPNRPLGRAPSAEELKSGFNLKAIDEHWLAAKEALSTTFINTTVSQQIADLFDQVQQADSTVAMAGIQTTIDGSQAIQDALRSMWEFGVAQAMAEAKHQGQTFDAPTYEEHGQEAMQAKALTTSMQIQRQVSVSASRSALLNAGSGKAAGVVADAMKADLLERSFADVGDRLGGALSNAMTAGRTAAFAMGPPADYYASEILDANTCAPCAGVDGTQYADLAAAEQDYVGGYCNCSGYDRCRGTLIAVYREDNAAVEVS